MGDKKVEVINSEGDKNSKCSVRASISGIINNL